MVQVGDIVYLCCKSKEDRKVRIRGTVVEEDSGALTVGFSVDLARNLANAVIYEKAEQPGCGFIKVGANSVSSVLPAGWGASVGGKAPALEAVLPVWDDISKTVGLESSEAEAVGKPKKNPAAAGASTQRSLETELARMQQELWQNQDSGDESSVSEDEDRPGSSGDVRHLAPGASSLKKKEKKDTEDSKPDMSSMVQQMMMQNLAGGQSANDLLPMMMFSMLMDQKKEKNRKSRKGKRDQIEILGGSSSDDSEDEPSKDLGMKAITTLHRMHRRITRHPRALVREFERDMVDELGIIPGQSWTVKEWLKKQPWGKFKGLYRSAVMDAAAYEFARNGNSEAAAAQLCQNMKSKLQAVLAGGDWQTAWLLTGLEDPLQKREFAGSKAEMAIISNYMSSLSKLRKKVRETGTIKEEEAE